MSRQRYDRLQKVVVVSPFAPDEKRQGYVVPIQVAKQSAIKKQAEELF